MSVICLCLYTLSCREKHDMAQCRPIGERMHLWPCKSMNLQGHLQITAQPKGPFASSASKRSTRVVCVGACPAHTSAHCTLLTTLVVTGNAGQCEIVGNAPASLLGCRLQRKIAELYSVDQPSHPLVRPVKVQGACTGSCASNLVRVASRLRSLAASQGWKTSGQYRDHMHAVFCP